MEKIKGKWYILDDFIPIFIPDDRKYKWLKGQLNFFHLYVMETIILHYKIYIGYHGINEKICETVVKDLKKAGMIITIEGCRPDSLNYTDYISSININEWNKKVEKQRWEYICMLLESTSSGALYGVTKAIRANP